MVTASQDKQLRFFGLLVGGIFVILAVWPPVLRNETPRFWALMLGFALITPAIISPGVLKWPYRVWMQVGYVLGWLNSRIIMTILFYFVFTPVGFIRRMGHDPLNRKFDPECYTYRIKRKSRSVSHMTHQF